MEAPPLAGHTLVPRTASSRSRNGRTRANLEERPIAGLHVHHSDDEAWYVLEGTLGFRLGDKTATAPAGAAVLAPAGTPHAYWTTGRGGPATCCSPRPPVRADRGLHAPGADFVAVFRKYDSELLEPSSLASG